MVAIQHYPFLGDPKTDMEAEPDWKDLRIKSGEVKRVSLPEE